MLRSFTQLTIEAGYERGQDHGFWANLAHRLHTRAVTVQEKGIAGDRSWLRTDSSRVIEGLARC